MEKLVAMDHDITVSEKLVGKQNEIEIENENLNETEGSPTGLKDVRSFKKLWQMLAVIMAIDLLVLFGTLILYNFVDTTGSKKESQEFISTNLSHFVTKIIWISYGLSTLLKTILFWIYHPWSSMKCKNLFSKSYKGCKPGLNVDVQQISQGHESMIQNKDEVSVITGAPDYHKSWWGKAYMVGINCLPPLICPTLVGNNSQVPMPSGVPF